MAGDRDRCDREVDRSCAETMAADDERFSAATVDAVELARSRFNLARALAASGREPDRVKDLYAKARDGFLALRDRGRIDLGIAEKWAQKNEIP